MRWILYIIIITFMYFAPIERLDVAKLEPIEAVAIDVEEAQVVLKTDTEREGRGANVPEALENLKENTPAVVYLDTAEYLLVAENAESLEQEVKTYLKAKVKTGPYAGGDVKEEAKFLETHMDSAKPVD